MAQKHDHACAIASALNIFGDRWTLLIVREAFYGATRFGEFLKNTGISKNLLTDRLSKLVEDGIFERVAFADRGTQYAYGLTEKGRALDVVMMAIQQWGDQHVWGPGQEPVICLERATDKPVATLKVRAADGTALSPDEVTVVPGPGADGRTRARIARMPAN